MSNLDQVLQDALIQPYPFINDRVSGRSRNLALCYGVISGRAADLHSLLSSRDPERPDLLEFVSKCEAQLEANTVSKLRWALVGARLMTRLGLDRRRLDALPAPLALAPRAALDACSRHAASVGGCAKGFLGPAEHLLIGREDLHAHCSTAPRDPGAFPSGSEDGIEDLEENKIAALR